MATIHNIVAAILNTLMPIWCIGCGKKGEQLCKPCLNRLFEIHEWCMVCRGFALNGICKKCRNGVALEQVFWVSAYGDALTRSVIGNLKYKGMRRLAPILASMMAHTIKGTISNDTHILAVPLHKRRERMRGFNQAELLASALAYNLSLPLIRRGVLVRTRNDIPQAKTKSREERRENIKGAFEVASNNDLTGKNILLVDDVATTGATLFEAARVVKEAGAQKISAAVFAHG